MSETVDLVWVSWARQSAPRNMGLPIGSSLTRASDVDILVYDRHAGVITIATDRGVFMVRPEPGTVMCVQSNDEKKEDAKPPRAKRGRSRPAG